MGNNLAFAKHFKSCVLFIWVLHEELERWRILTAVYFCLEIYIRKESNNWKKTQLSQQAQLQAGSCWLWTPVARMSEWKTFPWSQWTCDCTWEIVVPSPQHTFSGTRQKVGTARKCLQDRAFPLEGKREQAAQKTGAEAKILSEINLGCFFSYFRARTKPSNAEMQQMKQVMLFAAELWFFPAKIYQHRIFREHHPNHPGCLSSQGSQSHLPKD